MSALAPIAVTALLTGCGGSTGTGAQPPPIPETELAPDFALEDVNPTSATFGMAVSPRDYIGKVTGWYFGHAS